MRKFISIFLLISYFDTALAVGVDMHFCGGQVADIKLAGFGQAHCDCTEGSMPKGCCRNEFHFCKTDNHKGQVFAAVFASKSRIKSSVLIPDFISLLPFVYFEKGNSQTTNFNSIKFRPSWPLFILNKNFRL